ncbi:MAG: DUF1501 domain-containing protein [Planctomycetes bacterium]|nr:DUF1501 domain-containing protein [Planctomycetota bacterium]
MNDFSRRGFLGAAGAGLAAALNPLRGMNLTGPFAPPVKRLFTIFLRGAHDGVHTVFPVGDAAWVTMRSPLARPTVPLAGTTFAALNQDFRALTQNTVFSGTPPDLAGHVAWIHQAGNPLGERSHFTEQQIYETADVQPATSLNNEGFLPRVRQRLALAGPVPNLFGASVSRELQRMFRSTHPQGPMAHVDVDRLGTGGSPTGIRQRTALTPHLTQTPNPFATSPLALSVQAASTFGLATEAQIQSILPLPHNALFFPADATEAAAAGLPPSQIGYRMMRDCEAALALAMNPATSSRIVGVEMGGWDTHTDQVATRTVLDQWLAHALRAIYETTRSLNDRYTILVVTEFGRTNAPNSSASTAGTDHGIGGLTIVIDPAANGGVYNCHPGGGGGLGAAWGPATTPLNAQNVATDFRTIYAEILQKRLGMTNADLAQVIPGFTLQPFLNFLV